VPATVLNSGGEPSECEIVDLSLGGCRARISEAKFAPGEILKLSCVLPDRSYMGNIPCLVKRYYGARLYGLEFRQLSDKSKSVLENFLRVFRDIQSTGKDERGKHGMVGNLEGIPLPDLVQVLANSGKSYQLDIEQGSKRGRIYVKDGEIPHATTDLRGGIEAMFELFSWSGGQYQIQKAEWIPERNIDVELECLLIELARRFDDDQAMNSHQALSY
jgi:hypothetical protein